MNDGDLELTGDDEANSVDISVINGGIVVQGVDGTTINGSSDPFVAFAGTTIIEDDLKVSLGEGDDTLRLFGTFTVAGDTEITDLSGVTLLGMTGVTFEDDVRIRTGSEADQISIAGSTFANDLTIKAGAGDNVIALFESTVEGDTAISGDQHHHWSHRGRCHRRGPHASRYGWRHGNSFYDEGHGRDNSHNGTDDSSEAGNNQIVIQDSTLGDLKVRTGRGEDNLVIQDSMIDGDVKTSTGSGDDFVMADGLSVTDDARIRLGRGDDQLVTLNVNTIEDDLDADGGKGEDARQTSSETVVNGDTDFRRFELTTISDEQIEMRGTGALDAAAALRSILNIMTTMSSTLEDPFELV